MVRAIARYCAFRGTSEIDESELEGAVAPMSLGDGGRGAPKGGSVWSDTIGLCEEFGLVTKGGGTVRVDERVTEQFAEGDVARFRANLRAEVFASANNDGLWETTRKGSWSSDASREFSRVAVWFLEQRPDELLNADDTPYALARKEVEREGEKLVENQEQWRVFCRWAGALGLAMPVGDQHVPDVTQAVAEEFSMMFRSTQTLPAPDVRDELLKRIPVLRDGAYAGGLWKFVANSPTSAASEAGPAVGFALRRLSIRELISFKYDSDAPQLPIGEPEGQNPSHVTWRGKPE